MPTGISDLCGTEAGMVTSKGIMSTEGETLKFLSYLTGARYVHPWWRGRCQSCNQVPATRGKTRGIGGTYLPPMPRDLPQLRRRIVEAVVAIDHQMVERVWQELDYRIDICRVTRVGHTEHL
jgi:hypothetical protein